MISLTIPLHGLETVGWTERLRKTQASGNLSSNHKTTEVHVDLIDLTYVSLAQCITSSLHNALQTCL